MQHMLAGPNIGIVTTRNIETGHVAHVFCADSIIGHHAVSLKEVNYLLPLFLYPKEESDQHKLGSEWEKKANLDPAFIGKLGECITGKSGLSDLPEGVSPEDVLYYIYAVMHSQTYRTRYAEYLKRDFARIPLPTDKHMFCQLAKKGQELVALHLLKSPLLDTYITGFPEQGSNEVTAVSYFEKDSKVWINPLQFFTGVPKAVWNFVIGDDNPCERWLTDRKGHKLTYDDVQRWQRMVVAIKETMRLVEEIDSLIPTWPFA